MSTNPKKLTFSFDASSYWACGLFLFALAYRLLGVGWGLPNDRHWVSLHPDEPIIYLYSQQVRPGQLSFDPGFYNYGTLYLTLLRVSSDMINSYGGGPKTKSEEDTWRFIGRVDVAGRVINCLSGALTAALVFLALRRRTYLWGAVAGGIAMAVAPGHVIHSRFQTVDVFAAMLFLASVFCSMQLVPNRGGEYDEEPKWLKLALLAGLFAGLSGGTKYSGVLAILSLYAACCFIPIRQRLRLAAVGTGATVLGFFLGTPGVLTSTSKFIEDFRFEMNHTMAGHGLVFAGTQSGFLYHLANLSAGFGVILLILGAGGLLAAAIRKHPWAFVTLAAAIPTYILFGRAEVKFFRYVLPLMPLLAIGFGWLIGQAQLNPKRAWRVIVVAGLFGIGASFSQSLIATTYMMSKDPRDEAAEYLAKSTQPGEFVGLVTDPWFQSPTLYPLTAAPRSAPVQLRDEYMRSAEHPRVLRIAPENQADRKDWDLRLLDAKPQFIAYSSFENDDLARLARRANVEEEYAGQVADYKSFMEAMQKDYKLDNIFGLGGPTIHDLMYIRPTIYIWKRKTDSTTPLNGSSTTSGSNEVPASTP